MLIICLLITVAVSIPVFFALRGTTLVGPWCWSLVAILASSLAAFSAAKFGSLSLAQSSESVLGYLAAITSFGPTMALLGARRPHHRAWNSVVLGLWCVLALPAIQAAILRPGQPVTVSGIFVGFFWILIIAEILNRGRTSLWVVGALQAVCEVWLFAPHLSLVDTQDAGDYWRFGVFTQCLAVCIIVAFHYTKYSPPRDWTTLWLSFRNSFGVLWSLRVMERINSAATMLNWPLRLNWNGFHAIGDDASAQLLKDPEQRAAFEQTFVNLLRRFMSNSVIEGSIKSPR